MEKTAWKMENQCKDRHGSSYIQKGRGQGAAPGGEGKNIPFSLYKSTKERKKTAVFMENDEGSSDREGGMLLYYINYTKYRLNNSQRFVRKDVLLLQKFLKLKKFIDNFPSAGI